MRDFMPACRVVAVLALLLASVGCKTLGGAGNPIYRVRVETGDTLASIATKYDTTWEKIARLNDLEGGAPLAVGSVLRIEPGPGGIVAGARPLPPSAVSGASRGARAGRRAALAPGVKAASPDEFTEEDLPDAASDGRPVKRRGLFFGGDGDKTGASLSWPVQGELSSRFGQRDGRAHQGLDIRAPRGTAIRAASPGVVEFVGRKNGYGRTIIVRHGKMKTLYAHLNSVSVSRGDRVDTSTLLGTVGTSGNASGPHLHFECQTLAGKSFDPLAMLEEEHLLSSRH